MRPLFGKGALLIGEAGHELGDAKGKLALGGWTYTARQEDLRDTDPGGNPLPRRAFGFYALGEASLDPRLSVFARIGVSDGRSSPYQGGWQLGLLSKGLVKARPEAELSLGVYQARLTRRFRANLDDAGTPAGPSETGLELTWSDRIAPWLRLQPDVQFIRTAMRGALARDALVFTLRTNISLSSGGRE